MFRSLVTVGLFSLALATSLFAQRKYPPTLDGAEVHTYKQASGADLKLWVYSPEAHQATDKRPAIVFFFGGGWTSGSPEQFEQQCRYLASRGMVAITADYRVASRHQVKAVDCVRDAKSAMRWTRAHAAGLGIDPDRIAAGGGSAGGHLAACTATIDELDEADEDASVSSRPNALVLFNPAMAFDADDAKAEDARVRNLAERMGVDPQRLSPAHHVDGDVPPTLILIGTNDFLIEGNRTFDAKVKEADRRCDLDLYEGRTHGFFNYGRDGNEDFLATTESMDRFLASLGWLAGEPTVKTFFRRK